MEEAGLARTADPMLRESRRSRERGNSIIICLDTDILSDMIAIDPSKPLSTRHHRQILESH
jgi:hypothetical protein